MTIYELDKAVGLELTSRGHSQTEPLNWLAGKEFKLCKHNSQNHIVHHIPILWQLSISISISISPLKEPFKGNLGFPRKSSCLTATPKKWRTVKTLEQLGAHLSSTATAGREEIAYQASFPASTQRAQYGLIKEHSLNHCMHHENYPGRPIYGLIKEYGLNYMGIHHMI